MADVKDTYQGQGGQAGNIRWFRDNGDGTYAEEVSSELRAWDTNALQWVKLKVDGTGALSVTTAAGPGGSGVVTQGARDSTFQPWAVSISGTVSTAPSAGTQNVSLQNSSLPVTQGTSPWIVQGGSMSIAGTVLTSISGTTTVAGTVTANQGTSPWIIAGGNVSIAGTVITSISGTTTVAGTVTANQGTSPWLTSTSGSVAVTGTFFPTTQLVSLSGTNLVSQAGSFSVTQGTSPWIISGGAVSLAGTSLVSLSGTNLVSISGSVVQHQDVSRSAVTLFVDRTAGVTTEAAASMSATRAQASLAASTTYVVSAGKTLRIQSASLEGRTTAATTFSVRGRLRVGAASTVGPIVLPMEISTVSALAESTGAESYSFPDGIELPAGTSLSFSHVGSHTSSSMSMAISGFEY